MAFGDLKRKIYILLKKAKSIQPTDTVFLYLSQSVSPPPSLTIGELADNYGIDEGGQKKLPVKYALTEAWG